MLVKRSVPDYAEPSSRPSAKHTAAEYRLTAYEKSVDDGVEILFIAYAMNLTGPRTDRLHK